MPTNNKQPPSLRWCFAPDIPTRDFFEGMSLTEPWNLQEAVECFILWLEKDRFLTWEAVISREQGVPLTARQQHALASLRRSDVPAGDRVLYISDSPRPSQPWYAILNEIAPCLLVEPFQTAEVYDDVKSDGWPRMMTALDAHGEYLTLPSGVTSCAEVVPPEVRHRLWLQYCFDILAGLGQADELFLDEDDPWRVHEFILRLRQNKESVAYFGLTLEALLTRVILPERDRSLFLTLMRERLGLGSDREPIADRL
jgi:hypothetical protein